MLKLKNCNRLRGKKVFCVIERPLGRSNLKFSHQRDYYTFDFAQG